MQQSGVEYKVQTKSEGLEAFDHLGKSVGEATKAIGSMTDQMDGLGKHMFFLDELHRGLEIVNQNFQQLIQPGIQAQHGMAELGAITGVAGEQLNMIKDNAAETARAVSYTHLTLPTNREV